MKKILILAFCAIFFVSCKEKEKTFSLTMAEVNPENSICGQTDSKFCEEVERLSEGTIKIRLRAGGELGDEFTVIRALIDNKDSSIAFARISPFSLVSFNCLKSSIFTIPYTFQSRDHFWNFAKSPLADEVLNEPLERNLGIRGLFFAEEGFRCFFSTKDIKTPEDLKGHFVRVPDDPIMKALADEMQMKPKFVLFEDLVANFHTNQIEVAENPTVNYYANNFHRVAPYLLKDGHSIGALEVIANETIWEQFSEKQKNAIHEAGKIAADYCRSISENLENDALKNLKNEGCTINEVEDKEVWRKATEKVISDCSKRIYDFYHSVINLK